MPFTGLNSILTDFGVGAVPPTRLINTTLPLTGGGDLSADRTLSINDFTAIARGTVPASGGGTTNFLRADGTWTAPTGTTHNLLSATHPDTLVDSVVQGDVIFGNATPKWARLAANATSTNKFLRSVSSGIPSWQQVDYGSVTGIPPRKNFLDNANFNIWQRGTSFGPIASGSATYTADRFYCQHSSDGTITISQETSVLPTVAESGVKSLYSLKATPPTADATIAAGQYAFVAQVLEGYFVEYLMSQTVTLSFWVRSSKTGTYCISFRNPGADRSYVAEYTISVANTWEKKTITLTMLDGTAGTWQFDNRAGLYISWVLACGTTFQTTAGAWQNGNFLGTNNQVDWMDSNTATFYLSQVQLEVGSIATSLEYIHPAADMERCQRYLFVAGGTQFQVPGFGLAYSTTQFYIHITFPVRMRSVGSITATAADYVVTDGVTGTAVATLGSAGVGDFNNTLLAGTVAAGLTQYRMYFLQLSVNSSLLIVSAEL